MPFTATVHRVMIASPGDVHGERSLVREVVHEWNAVHAARRGLVLLPLGWETNVAPEMGDEPQSIINERILDDADLLVGIFWTRLGTPTAGYASGTVEEIEEHLAAGRPAMLYFSAAPVMLESVDPDQYRALKAFRDECRTRGIYETYTDLADFRQKLARHLQIVLNGEAFQGVGEAPDEPAAREAPLADTLSREAAILLQAGSRDPGGVILCLRYGMGTTVQANEQAFNEATDARSVATWEGALEELERHGLVRVTSDRREVFELTRRGFEVADTLAV